MYISINIIAHLLNVIVYFIIVQNKYFSIVIQISFITQQGILP